MNQFAEEVPRNLLSPILDIKPSTVVTSPPNVPLESSNSSSGIATAAVSDYNDRDTISNNKKAIQQYQQFDATWIQNIKLLFPYRLKKIKSQNLKI